MAKNSIIKVTIGKVYTESGVECKNPIVKLIGYPNVYINCIDETKGIYKLQLPDNTDVSGLQFSVDCNLTDCPTCDTQIKEFYFCEDTGDCPDCSDCNKATGLCEPRCETEFCLDDSCVECTTDSHCDCDQKCDENGNCGCPNGFYVGTNGCCRECETSADCGACKECTENGNCVPKECVEGTCDPDTDVCVDCLNGDDCPDPNAICSETNECICIDGYVFDNCLGICVEAPINPCTQNDDCGSCFECTNINTCTGYGSCTPISCPEGKVCYEGDCVDQCDCGSGDCDNVTDFCGDVNGTDCGCIECVGDCDQGCGDGCFCNPITNQCEGNPCANTSCSNGLDCGDGCGCLDGQCVPCDSLNCSGTSCAETLGCGCDGGVCKDSDDKDGCNNEPCSIADDCGDGCTCYEGSCVSCENFSCENGDCLSKDGCTCQGNACVGSDNDCTDTVTLEKVDEDCELVGELQKENCCSCSKLTLDVKGKLTAPIDSLKTEGVSFKVELRKGDFNTFGNINALPLLDDTFNRDIADNETPISGQVTISYTTYYDVYNLNEDEDGKGNTLLSFNDSKTGSVFASSGDQKSGTPLNFNTSSATVTINNVRLDKIGAEGIFDDEWWVVKKVVVNFSITKKFTFPNECEYIDSDKITYTITNSNNYERFSKTGFTAVKGNLLSSDDCRLPLFKWYKSVDNAFNEEEVIVKRYVEESATNIWTDILDSDDGIESCYNYNLEVDCNCDEPAFDYVVFCNPVDIAFDLSNCNTSFTLKEPFTPCLTNQQNLTYFIELKTTGGNDVIRTFTYATKSTIIGENISTDSQINKIRYGIYCNGEEYADCTKEYEVTVTELPYADEVTVDCNNGQINALFSDTVTVNSQTFTVDRIELSEVGGSIFTTVNSTSGWNKILPAGTYNVKVYWVENCDPTEFVLQEDCCGGTIPIIVRNCDGSWIGEYNDNFTYQINGTLLSFDDSEDLVNFLTSNYPEDQVTVKISNGNCSAKVFSYPSLTDSCCGLFGLSYKQNTNTSATVNITGSYDVIESPTLTLEAYKGSVTLANKLPVTKNSIGIYTVTGYEEGDTVVLILNSDTCGNFNTHFRASTCNLDLVLTEYPTADKELCRIKAEIDPVTCGCPDLNITTELTNVVFGTESLLVTYKSFPIGFSQSDVDSFEYTAGKRGTDKQDINLLDSGVIEIPYTNTTVISDCYFDSTIKFKLDEDISNDGKNRIEILSITKSGLPIVDDSKLLGIRVTVSNGVVSEDANYNSITKSWITSYLFLPFEDITITVNITSNDGGAYNGFVSKTIDPFFAINTFAIKICRELLAPFEQVLFDFVLSNLILKDGCTYSDNSTISYTLSSNGSTITPSGQQIIGLEPSIPANIQLPAIKWIKDDVTLDIGGELEDGKLKIIDNTLNDNGKYEDVLDIGFLTSGSTYTVIVQCASCTTSAQKLLTCLPQIDINVVGDNTSMVVTITGTPGDYVIDYDTDLFEITIEDSPLNDDGDGTKDLTIPGPLNSSVLTLCEQGTGLCYTVTLDDVTLYLPSYIDIYTPIYLTPSYAPIYTPGYSPDAYTPTYTPIYLTPSYTPIYTPIYLTPSYTPDYIPNYVPGYATPTYVTPTYQPAAYVPTYVTPSYVDLYAPNYLTPTYVTPSYIPVYVPDYSPDYVTPSYLTPSYLTPTYLTPSYIPVYVPNAIEGTPAVSPIGLAPFAYTPNYITPSYTTPSYTPIYVPFFLQCNGCEYLGVCCNDINNISECESVASPLTLAEINEVKVMMGEAEILVDDGVSPCVWVFPGDYCECRNIA